MIDFRGVTKKYGQSVVLKDITMKISEPGIYCLLGRNGAGKMTLLKTIAGYQNATSGSVTVDGRIISAAVLDTGVSYIENSAKQFNLPVQKLIRIAGDVQGNFDYDFALEMMDRFELNGKKKYKQLSLGMKTMVSTIICLGSNNSVILLDEPVLGFDAIMRMEFYNLLSESYRRHSRIILISTHIIEEIADTVQYLIILDKGSIRFFDSLETVGSKAFSISGLKGKVEKVSASLNVIAKDEIGGLVTNYIFDTPPAPSDGIEIRSMSLQDLFIQLVGRKGRER